MRGQSLVHPDAATWTAFAVTVAVTALLAALTILAARRGAPARGRHALDTRMRRELALPAK
jgi:hypothetical protein